MGHIRLLNISLFGHHGVARAERETGTRLEFDLDLMVDCAPAVRSDAVEDAVDYLAVHQVLEAIVSEERHQLLESLAGSIARRMLEEFPAQAVTVRIRKSNLPLPGGKVEVELERVR